jgi:hypothetical protein
MCIPVAGRELHARFAGDLDGPAHCVWAADCPPERAVDAYRDIEARSLRGRGIIVFMALPSLHTSERLIAGEPVRPRPSCTAHSLG